MKRYIIMSAIALLASCGNVEEAVNPVNVPQPVLKAFDAKYPTVNKCLWFKAVENEKTIYKADWKRDGKHVKSDFDGQGIFLKEE